MTEEERNKKIREGIAKFWKNEEEVALWRLRVRKTRERTLKKQAIRSLYKLVNS